MIFLLFLIGSTLIILNVWALRKEKNSFQFKLDNAGDNMEEFEVQIGKLRKEFSETILELQMEIQSLNKEFNKYTGIIDATEVSLDEISGAKIKEKVDIYDIKREEVNVIENNTANSVKINEIEKLISQGLSIENIAEKLSMGKGEVLLIKQLYIK